MKTILTLTGASGCGKDSMLDTLIYLFGKRDVNLIRNSPGIIFEHLLVYSDKSIRELVSHTTRNMRNYEKNGVDYFFIKREEFDPKDFVEVTEYAGNRYGLSRKEVSSIKENEIGAVIVDKFGVKEIHQYAVENNIKHISVFLGIDANISGARMEKRGDSEESIAKRLKQQEDNEEYSPDFDYTLDLCNASVTDFTNNVFKIIDTLVHS